MFFLSEGLDDTSMAIWDVRLQGKSGSMWFASCSQLGQETCMLLSRRQIAACIIL